MSKSFFEGKSRPFIEGPAGKRMLREEIAEGILDGKTRSKNISSDKTVDFGSGNEDAEASSVDAGTSHKNLELGIARIKELAENVRGEMVGTYTYMDGYHNDDFSAYLKTIAKEGESKIIEELGVANKWAYLLKDRDFSHTELRPLTDDMLVEADDLSQEKRRERKLYLGDKAIGSKRFREKDDLELCFVDGRPVTSDDYQKFVTATTTLLREKMQEKSVEKSGSDGRMVLSDQLRKKIDTVSFAECDRSIHQHAVYVRPGQILPLHNERGGRVAVLDWKAWQRGERIEKETPLSKDGTNNSEPTAFIVEPNTLVVRVVDVQQKDDYWVEDSYYICE